MHDAQCARRTYADLRPTDNPQILVNQLGSLKLADVSLHDWRGVLVLEDRETNILHGLGKAGDFFIPRLEHPVAGLAEAELGHFATAEGVLADCPADSDVCMRARGQLRAAEGKWAAADYWFARAVRDAPHTPFGYEVWGEALKKGDAPRAISLFAKANAIAPHFADPLEQWGQALMAERRSDLAVEKFAEAAKYAPEWGRLHLKWGEALTYTGDKRAAEKQFTQLARANARRHHGAGAGEKVLKLSDGFSKLQIEQIYPADMERALGTEVRFRSYRSKFHSSSQASFRLQLASPKDSAGAQLLSPQDRPLHQQTPQSLGSNT